MNTLEFVIYLEQFNIIDNLISVIWVCLAGQMREMVMPSV